MLNKAIKKAKETMNKGYGGPFGASILDKDGNEIAVSSNTVLKDNDPTAHAEVNAIRKACKKLKTHDLKGCTLYTTCYPCPMCLSAIIWANISNVYYGSTKEDAAAIGFRDDHIYKYIENGCINEKIIKFEQIYHDKCKKLFEEYKNNNGEMY